MPQDAALQATPAIVSKGTPAEEETASDEHALAIRPGSRLAIGSQPARAGPSEVFFAPLMQEEAGMAAVS